MDSLFFVLIGGLFISIGSAVVLYRGGRAAIGGLAVITALFLFLPGFDIDKLGLLAPLCVGIPGGLAFRKGKSLAWYILAASAAMTFLFSGQFYYQTEIGHIDVLGGLKTQFEQTLRGSDAPDDMKEAMMESFRMWVDGTGKQIIPFLFFMNGLLFAALALPFMSMLFRRLGGAPLRGLEYFRLHDYAIFALIAGWGAVLLFDGVAGAAGLNLALCASVLYFVQALGVVKFLLMKRGMPGYLLPVLMAVTLVSGILVFSFILVMLAGLGALDFWADFRKLEKKPI